ncbi:MAG TPA: energy transducer TonB [Steroidobacteraceae bacterium]
MASSAPSTGSRSVETDAGPSAQPSAKPAGEVIAITQRDDFLLELGESLGGQAAVHPVDSFAAAVERLAGARRALLLAIDSRDAADLRGDAERAHGQVPHVPVIVFAPTELEKTVAGALKSSNVFAVLPIPVDRRKTAAVFEGAFADAQAKRTAPRAAGAGEARGAQADPRSRDAERRGGDLRMRDADRTGEFRFEARSPLSPEPMPEASDTALAPAEPPSGLPKPAMWAIAAVAVAALAGGAYWLFGRGSAHPHATAAVTPAPKASPAPTQAASPAAETAAPSASTEPQTSLVQGTLDSLLEKARLAMRERRYTEPTSNCALLYYRSALGVDPTNGEARDGMARLATLLVSRFGESLSGGKLDEASGSLASLKIASPNDARLPGLENRLLQAQISGAFAAGNVDRATALIRQAQQSSAFPAGELSKWRAELAKHQSESRVNHLAELIASRIRDGRLVDPADDSAKYFLQQLKQTDASNSQTRQASRDLVSALLRKAREAAIAGQTAQASSWVTEARGAGMSSTDYTAYQRDVASAKQRAAVAQTDRLVELARARLQDGNLTDPANDSAASYLIQLKNARANDATLTPLSRELATRLLERATASARAGRADQMRADLALARQWGADPALLQAVTDVLTGRSGAPAQAAALSTPRAIPPGYVPQRTRYVAPEYPEQALDQHISGSVTVEFTIDKRGRPSNVHVVDSTPEDVFDRAATKAVTGWRYKPAVFDGVPTEVPTRMIIRFEAPKN